MNLNNSKAAHHITKSSDSDSDLGLPPPIPVQKAFQLPKLAISGLGLSTLAKNAGGKTAEEIADMEILKNGKVKSESISNEDSEESRQRDDQ